MKKIAILGTFDVDNYGDCLFPDVIRFGLDNLNLDFEIDCFSPTNKVSSLCSFQNLKSIPKDSFNNEEYFALASYDVVALTGGDTIWSGNYSGTYANLGLDGFSAGMRLWATPLLATSSQTKSVILGAGVGVLSNSSLSFLKENIFRYDYFSVRDSLSSNKLGDLPNVSPDIAFSLSKTMPVERLQKIANLDGYNLPEKFLVFQMSITYDHYDLNEVLDEVIKISKQEDCKIVLLPLCIFLGDNKNLKRAQKILLNKGTDSILVEVDSSLKMLRILAEADGYIGTSLHGGITSYAYGSKTIVLATKKNSKHFGVFDVVTEAKSVCVTSATDIIKTWNSFNIEYEKERCENSANTLLTDLHVIFSTQKDDVKNNRLFNDNLDVLKKVVEQEQIDFDFKYRFKHLIYSWLTNSPSLLKSYNYVRYVLVGVFKRR